MTVTLNLYTNPFWLKPRTQNTRTMKSPNNAQVAKMTLAFSNCPSSEADLDQLLDSGAVDLLMGVNPQHIDMAALRSALGYPKLFSPVEVDYDLKANAAIKEAGIVFKSKMHKIDWTKAKNKSGKQNVTFAILNPNYDLGFSIHDYNNHEYALEEKRHRIRGANWQEVLAFSKHFPDEQLTNRITGTGTWITAEQNAHQDGYTYYLLLGQEDNVRTGELLGWTSLTHKDEGWRFLCVREQ